MKKQVKKEGFKRLSIKNSVAFRFRKFSNQLGLRHSASLDLMLDFFENNRISPSQDLGPNMKTLERVLKKRIDACIAIIRDIENTQTKPTQAMLAALFEGLPSITERKSPTSFERAMQNTLAHSPEPQKEPQALPQDKDLKNLLEQIEQVKPAFGKPYLKIDMPLSEIESLKQKYHVHHRQSTET